MCVTDATWDVGSSGRKYESNLKVKLLEMMRTESKGSISNSALHTKLKKHVDDCSVGDLQGMSHSSFNDWVNGKRSAQRGIKKSVLCAFNDYIAKHGPEANGVNCQCLSTLKKGG